MMKHYMKDGSEVLRFMGVTALMVAVVGVVALLVAVPSSAGPGEPIQRASALLRPIEGSGIRGNVVIRDNGSNLTVSGTAWGLDPKAPGGYISLFYDILSVTTGEEPCVRGLSDGDPLGLSAAERGEVAPHQLIWDVSPNGDGSLNGTVEVGLDRVRTISIRSCNGACYYRADPLEACGLIVVH